MRPVPRRCTRCGTRYRLEHMNTNTIDGAQRLAPARSGCAMARLERGNTGAPDDRAKSHPKGRGGATLSAGRSARSRAWRGAHKSHGGAVRPAARCSSWRPTRPIDGSISRIAWRGAHKSHGGAVRPAVAVRPGDRRGRSTGRCRASPRFRRATPPGRPCQITSEGPRRGNAFGRPLRALGGGPVRARGARAQFHGGAVDVGVLISSSAGRAPRARRMRARRRGTFR